MLEVPKSSGNLIKLYDYKSIPVSYCLFQKQLLSKKLRHHKVDSRGSLINSSGFLMTVSMGDKASKLVELFH